MYLQCKPVLQGFRCTCMYCGVQFYDLQGIPDVVPEEPVITKEGYDLAASLIRHLDELEGINAKR